MSSSAENNNNNHDFENEEDVNYTPAKQESIDDILKKDAEDESLRRYKEQLLGAAAKGVPKTDDPRLVVIVSFGILFPNGEHADIIRELDTQEKVDSLKKTPIIVKEGVDYKFQVQFKVQHEIVSALKFENVVKKGFITADKSSFMMGSYAPAADVYTFKTPVQTAPSGSLARGKFKARTKFIDDYKKCHLDLEYTLQIAKTFEG